MKKHAVLSKPQRENLAKNSAHASIEEDKVNAESQALLNSVKAWFNRPEELSQRSNEADNGLSKTEQAFVDALPAGSRCLDIGCATGRLVFALAKQGYASTGIDVAEEQIAQAQQFAQQRDCNATFLRYEPPTLPFPNASFDAAFLVKTYCYMPHRAARIAFLAEIARILTPNGYLYLSQQILDSFCDSYEPTYDDNYHQFASDYETLEAGDNFTLGTPSYVHFFFAADLGEEIAASPFWIAHSSVDSELLSCILRK